MTSGTGDGEWGLYLQDLSEQHRQINNKQAPFPAYRQTVRRSNRGRKKSTTMLVSG
ncbi:MAG: hypothetical protein QNJ70_06015 [Xenococcaceae cyanobacterium MO_207.B15]|nr:hypothetical protein [Xenococcaceae cyanobacterium MO_207.B15]